LSIPIRLAAKKENTPDGNKLADDLLIAPPKLLGELAALHYAKQVPPNP